MEQSRADSKSSRYRWTLGSTGCTRRSSSNGGYGIRIQPFGCQDGCGLRTTRRRDEQRLRASMNASSGWMDGLRGWSASWISSSTAFCHQSHERIRARQSCSLCAVRCRGALPERRPRPKPQAGARRGDRTRSALADGIRPGRSRWAAARFSGESHSPRHEWGQRSARASDDSRETACRAHRHRTPLRRHRRRASC